MDPDLWELIEYGKPADEVAAILRLGHSTGLPAGVRVISQFGEIATVRLKRSDILNIHRASEVVGMAAGWTYLGPDVELTEESSEHPSAFRPETDERRPSSLTATGRGVVVGVVDWGFDFNHPDFLDAGGNSRILALWDQRGGKHSASPKPFGYGRVHDQVAINRALKSADPYAALGYHPADADTGEGSHGTHVASIAAGSGGEDRPVGVAPAADLVFVHSAPWDALGVGKLGDSVTLLEAIDFIGRMAGDRPWVINLSMGRHGEQHDGSTLVEQGLDAAVLAAPGRAICMSAGNYFDKNVHHSGHLRGTEKRTFVWVINEGDVTENELEIWYSGRDKMDLELRSPNQSIVARVKLGDRAQLKVSGVEVGNIYHGLQDSRNQDNHIDIFLYQKAAPGPWEVTLTATDVVDGRFHAWIERDAACPGCQSRLRAADAVSRSTTGTICNGLRTIAVGAYDRHDPELRIGRFSSSGPTRDGRLKPDLCAPGVSILSARSAPRDKTKKTPLVTRMSGTSMAAPHVAGTVALMFEAAPRRLRVVETRNLLLLSADRVSVQEDLANRVGIGYLDIKCAVEATRSVGEAERPTKQEIEATGEIDQLPRQQPSGLDGALEYVTSGVTGSENRRDAGPGVELASGMPAEYSASRAAELEVASESESELEDFFGRRGTLELSSFDVDWDASDMSQSERFPTSRLASEGMCCDSTESDDSHAGTWADVADSVLATRAHASAGRVLEELLAREVPGVPPNPPGLSSRVPLPGIFEAFSDGNGGSTLRNHYERFFRVIGFPRAVWQEEPRVGDVLVRRGEKGWRHIAILAGAPMSITSLAADGLRAETSQPGFYAHVVEGGTVPHRLEDRFARRLASDDRYVENHQLILRFVPTLLVTKALTSGRAPAMVGTEPDPGSDEAESPASTSLPSDRLQWVRATPEQQEFMREVYDRQVRNASDARSFVADIPALEREAIEAGQTLRKPAAGACRSLLTEARARLSDEKVSGSTHARSVTAIRVVSGYRPASRQFANWQRNFPRYYEETRQRREALTSGEHGAAAVGLLASYIGRRLAAPGFSYHNDGLAVDFGTTEAGIDLGASTSAASIRSWKTSWLFAWLGSNAGRFHFYQNTRIQEPWHWEYRATPAAEQPDEESSASFAESFAVPAGREEIRDLPLLQSHVGQSPDLILRWNDMRNVPSAVDVVVHLHGYSGKGKGMRLPHDKEPISGLDFNDPDDPQSPEPGRQQPTLGVLARGHYFGGDSGAGYSFPALTRSSGIEQLIEYALQHFGRRVGTVDLKMGRLTLSAHSGGGAALLKILSQEDPDEVHLFDAIYQDAASLLRWVRQRIERDYALLQGGTGRDPQSFLKAKGGALRVVFRTGTSKNTRPLYRDLTRILLRLPDRGAALGARYRVEQTNIGHNEIPRRFGWRLLADAGAALPSVFPIVGRSVPASDEVEVEDEIAEEYLPPQGRRYSASTTYPFRCPPNPRPLAPATELPVATTTPDDTMTVALQAAGLTLGDVGRFARHGFASLRPIASAFGTAALTELIGRLRYSAAEIESPPYTYDNDATLRRRLGVPGRAALLAPRLLLAIPGHFRELARRSPTAREAHALECLGWLFADSLRDRINAVTGVNWWLPPRPSFVTAFASLLPSLSPEVQALIIGGFLIDTTLSSADFNGSFRAWEQGLPGQAWRGETGLAASPAGAGQPFYSELVNIPPIVNLAAANQQLQQAWQRRLDDVDAQFPMHTDPSTQALRRCANNYWPAGLMQPCSVRGLGLVYDFPARVGDRLIRTVNVLGDIRPTLESAFESICLLGWNDLLFQTAGAGCFRGKKRPASPNDPMAHHRLARRMSEHSLGIAIDFNTFENAQRPGSDSMDPRIVAAFEAYRFRWGRCFPTPDPMHFEYCGGRC